MNRRLFNFIPMVMLVLCFGFSGVGFAGQRKIPFQLKQSEPAIKVSPATLNQQVAQVIVDQTNQIRQKRGLAPLSVHSILVKAARDHSEDMLKRNYLSHFSPEKKSVVDRVKRYVTKLPTSLGENLHTISSSRGLYDAQAIGQLMVKDWMGSKSHRKNIVAKKFIQTGVACASNGSIIDCTQVFSGSEL